MYRPKNSLRSTTDPAVIQPTRWVVYRDVGDLFVFASVDLAVHLDAIYGALNESNTWGEFRRRLPAGEWPAIEQRLFLGEDEVEEEDRSHWEDDDAPFMVERVRGIDDTSYPLIGPEWLGDVDAFPGVLIKAHNELLVSSTERSVYWQIPIECAATVAETLRDWGYLVERTDFLEFC